MPTGRRPRSARRRGPSAARGFTYLALLALLAVHGAALAMLGQSWTAAMQREKERELRFRGQEIVRAVDAYWRAEEPRRYPPTLEALLEDRRGARPRHHLRRLYVDPFTGRADWNLITEDAALPGGPPPGIVGVASRSRSVRWAQDGVGAAGGVPRVSDWRFVHEPPAEPATAEPAEAATGEAPAAEGPAPIPDGTTAPNESGP